jgi:hypothetical protein
MGTSNSYGGPTGGNPLLPPWAQQSAEPAPDQNAPGPASGEDENDNGSEQSDSNSAATTGEDKPPFTLTATATRRTSRGPTSSHWSSAKGNMTRFAGGGRRRNLSNAGRAYVRARGGARGAASSSRASRASTARLAGFLSNVAARGTGAAITALGLSIVVGQSAETILAAIADALAPEGALLEDSVARQAIDDVLLLLFERYDLENGSINNLDAMDASAVREVIVLSVAQSIYLRWLEDLGKCIETGTATANEALRLEREVKDYVRETLTLDLQGQDVLRIDWKGREGQNIVERIYQEAYGFLEAGE